MKKWFILLIFIVFMSVVRADTNIDVTADVNIKYKWYKEEVEELYYPKGMELSDYIENDSIVKYGEFSDWDSEYCSYSSDNYIISKKDIITYDRLDKIRYALFQNASTTCSSGKCINNVEIYYHNQKIEYKKIRDNYYGLLFDLENEYDPSELLFYVDTDHLYILYLSKEKNIPPIVIESPATNKKIIAMDTTWAIRDLAYVSTQTENEDDIASFAKNINKDIVCRVQAINTYRYKITKKYYDDNYYTSMDGYVPEVTSYIVTYNKELPTEVVEVIKEKEVPKIEKEYIYMEQNNENVNTNEENDDNNKEYINESVIYETKYIDREINKIPIKVYVIFSFLILVNIVLLVKLIAKKGD